MIDVCIVEKYNTVRSDNIVFVIILAKSSDPDEILNLLELVIGVAVMCEDKAVFIAKIFELNDVSQAVLKGLVEQVMGRAEDIEEDDKDHDAAATATNAVDGAESVDDLHLHANLSEQEQLR